MFMFIRLCQSRLLRVSGITCSLFLIGSAALAQITPDTTLGGEESVVTQDVVKNLPITIIKGGSIRGKNLFHSFSEFTVENSRGAYFFDPTGVENIVARITGNKISNIAGTLGVLGDSNLFLINPNGIIFEKNSRLDLNGSFFASTARSVVFDNNFEFSVFNASTPPLLTINTPIGLRFGTRPGSIINQSITRNNSGRAVGLQVQPGKTIGLIGGDISFDQGLLRSPGSEVYIGSVGSDSFVATKLSSAGWKIGYEYAGSFQDIQLLNANSSVASISTSGLSSGNIQLRGRRIQISGGGVTSLNSGDNPGGNISVFASESLTIDNNELPSGNFGGLVTSALFGSTGNAGNIYVEAPKVTLKAQPGSFSASIRTSSDGSGNGGNITINASDLIEIYGGEFNTETNGFGNAGNLDLSTSKLVLRDGGTIISSSNLDAIGNSGNIKIGAAELVEVSNSTIGAFSTSTGNAGNILINTFDLAVQDDGLVTVNSQGGVSGNLEINARSILLQNNGSLAAETMGGEGNIILGSSDIILRKNSLITTNAMGSAKGGNITINTGVLVALENSDITANSEENFGGRVSISARGIFGTQFRENLTPESDITATSALGPNFSGTVELNITAVDPSQGLVELPATVVDPKTLVTQNPCRRTSSSEFTRSGRGGLPPSLSQDLNSDSTQVGLVEPTNLGAEKPDPKSDSKQASSLPPSSSQIVPAQGWVYNNKGEVVLVAYNSAATGPQRPQSTPKGCPVL